MNPDPPTLPGEPDPEGTGSRFFRLMVHRPVMLAVLLATLILVGVIAYTRIPLQMLPEGWTEPNLAIYLPNPGSNARENERKVAQVVEEQLRTLSGVEEIRSRSRDDEVWISVSFAADLDMDFARAEVRDRLERARPQLPTTVERISVWSEDFSQMPIIWFSILHKGDGNRTDFLLDTIVRPRLEAVPGVGRVNMWGDRQDSIRIELDEERVLAARLDLGEVIRRLSRDNFALPLGEVEDGGQQVILRSDMRFRTVEEVAAFPVGNGLTLGDLGEVIRAKSVRDRVSRVDGDYSYFCWITKDSQANIVDTSRALVDKLDELRELPELQGEMDFAVFGTQGQFIEGALGQMRQTALLGGLFAVIVLQLFLRRIRLTLCVALSIPISILLALSTEYFLGHSFNVLTMAGLTLAIGMLVDNSVVVIENIARVRALGFSSLEAATRGTREIALAVTLATMTTVVVFMPLIFMSEHPILRLAMMSLGIPLCTALCFSLLTALIFLPAVAGRSLGERPRYAAWLAARLEPLLGGPVRGIARVVGGLRWLGWRTARVLHRGLSLAGTLLGPLPVRAALAILVLAWAVRRTLDEPAALAVAERLRDFGTAPLLGPQEPASYAVGAYLVPGILAALALWFLPAYLRRRLGGRPVRAERFTPPGRSLVDMITALQQRVMAWSLEHRLGASACATLALGTVLIPVLAGLRLASFGDDEETSSVEFYVQFGDDYSLADASAQMRPYEELVESRREEYGYAHWHSNFDADSGSFDIYWDDRLTAERLAEIRRTLKKDLPDLPGHEISFWGDQDQMAAGSKQQFAEFVLRGQDSTELDRLGAEAVAILEQLPSLTRVESPLADSPDQVRVVMNRDMAHTFGVTADNTFQSVSWALRGFLLPRFHDEGREIPFIIEYDQDKTAGLATLRDLPIYTGETSVALSSFSDIEFVPGQRSIRRTNGWTSFTIRGELAEGAHLEDVEEQGYEALAALELPRGYSWGVENSAISQQQEETTTMLLTILLGFVLVLLLMAILFESILLPFSVLVTVPFAVVGALWTLFLLNRPLDSLGWIGIVILLGVVVNNGIVLIDRIHNLKASGTDRTQAVLEGCQQRLRPILMTALTTVFGLAPMIVAAPATNTFDYRSLASCFAGGLVASTFFTLWTVPVAYTVLDDFWIAMKRWTGWWIRGRGARRSGGTPPEAGEKWSGPDWLGGDELGRLPEGAGPR